MSSQQSKEKKNSEKNNGDGRNLSEKEKKLIVVYAMNWRKSNIFVASIRMKKKSPKIRPWFISNECHIIQYSICFAKNQERAESFSLLILEFFPFLFSFIASIWMENDVIEEVSDLYVPLWEKYLRIFFDDNFFLSFLLVIGGGFYSFIIIIFGFNSFFFTISMRVINVIMCSMGSSETKTVTESNFIRLESLCSMWFSTIYVCVCLLGFSRFWWTIGCLV